MCEVCATSKTGSGAHTKTATPATKPLQRVFTDIVQLTATPSFTKFIWQITFVDEYSRMAFIYPMHAKSEVVQKFRQFSVGCNYVGEETRIAISN